MSVAESLSKPNKCFRCSKAIKNEKIYACGDCSEVFCKDHIRINPGTLCYYCIKCFTQNLKEEADSEMQDEFQLVMNKKKHIKEKLNSTKKEIKSKAKTIDRLEESIKSNNSNYEIRLEKYAEKIKDEERIEKNIIASLESLNKTIEDLKEEYSVELKKLEEAKEEQNKIRTELDLMRQENVIMKNQIRDAEALIPNIVPYSRLRNLPCKHCKHKIKEAFKQIIVLGNQGRMSILQSVLEYRLSSYSKVSVVKNRPTINKNGAGDTCKCEIF